MEKIYLVTGATSGIGKATAMELARAGATVVIGARNAKGGESARDEICAASGNQKVDTLIGDLSSLASIHGMADTFRAKYPHLNVLINNAGVFKSTRSLSADGFELMFATNHLAPFLLTNLLLDPLKASGAARVLNIAAPSSTKLDFNDLQGEKKFNAINALGASKMASQLFSFELARRLAGTGITVNAIHPGLVRSNIMNDANVFMRVMSSLFSGSPEKAAQAIVRVALGEEYQDKTGLFYSQGKEIQANKYAHDRDIQKRLWDVSEKLAGL
jgi:NAD(P)-dependent dehydrogenase (short-subunit alcohol dehydrogenase family)